MAHFKITCLVFLVDARANPYGLPMILPLRIVLYANDPKWNMEAYRIYEVATYKPFMSPNDVPLLQVNAWLSREFFFRLENYILDPTRFGMQAAIVHSNRRTNSAKVRRLIGLSHVN